MKVLHVLLLMLVYATYASAQSRIEDVPMGESRSIGKANSETAFALIAKLTYEADKTAPGLVNSRLSFQNDPNSYGFSTHDDVVMFSRGTIGVVYSAKTGRLLRFGFGQVNVNPEPPYLPVSVCEQNARRFYQVGGGTCDLRILDTSFPGNNGEASPFSDTVQFLFDQFAPGEPYRIGPPVDIQIDRKYGLPEHVEMGYVPEYERATDVAPTEAAAQSAAATVAEEIGWERVEVGVQPPRYVVPAYAALKNWRTERHIRLAKEGKACLIYEVSVNDATSFDETAKRYQRFVQVYVDAETGQTIAFMPAFMMKGDLSATDARIVDARETWLVGKTQGTLAPIAEAIPQKGKRVMLRTQAGSWIIGHYDARRNLLWFTVSGKAKVYRPSKDLAKALSQTAPK